MNIDMDPRKQPAGELALDTHVVVSLSWGQLLSSDTKGRLAWECA